MKNLKSVLSILDFMTRSGKGVIIMEVVVALSDTRRPEELLICLVASFMAPFEIESSMLTMIS